MSLRSALKFLLTLVGIIFLYMLFFYIIGPLFHELGHVLMAIIIGVPFEGLSFSFFPGLGPGVNIPKYVPVESFKYIRYAGGIFSGILLAVGYTFFFISHRKAFTESEWWINYKWWIGWILLFNIVYNFFVSYCEGTHYIEYIDGVIPTETHFLIVIVISLALNFTVSIIFRKRES